jgi:hypothetical protein
MLQDQHLAASTSIFYFIYSYSMSVLEYSVFFLTDSHNLSFPLFYRSSRLKRLEEPESSYLAGSSYLGDLNYGKVVIYCSQFVLYCMLLGYGKVVTYCSHTGSVIVIYV